MRDQQLPLFPNTMPPAQNMLADETDYGTFKDSLRAPVHNWFRYPAGFSYKLVRSLITRHGIVPGQWLYDPFSGTGTTLIVAKQHGIHACGVEAHAFVHWVAQVKLFWEFDRAQLPEIIKGLLERASRALHDETEALTLDSIFPELVYKCFHSDDLRALYVLRQFILTQIDDSHIRDLLKLALTDTLRSAAAAGTGWPYIAPRKNTGDKPPKGAFTLFTATVWRMVRDVLAIQHPAFSPQILNLLGDSRSSQPIENGQIDLAITSPPYLNNYDYADRTRLETYFWGIAHSWRDITEQFRNKLLVAATTQIVRRDHQIEQALSADLRTVAPDIYHRLQNSILALREQRLIKDGRKDYDLMVALYFNGMLQVLQETWRVLKPGGHFCLVLGDSAPYGVHIPTDDLIGQIGLKLGFDSYVYEAFRTRGDKWKANPQRHTVPLREGMIVLRKPR